MVLNGYDKDLWELCVIEFEDKSNMGPGPYELIYPEQIVGKDNLGPIGYLTEHDVIKLLDKIKNLIKFYVL